MASTSKKILTLRSSDGETFEVSEAVAVESQKIKHMMEDVADDNDVIPIPKVSGKTLSLVLEFCNKHAVHKGKMMSEEEVKAWDADFVKVDQNTLFELVLAAYSLGIKSLSDLACKSVADMMKGKSPEEIRRIFHVKNDYTPEEEAEVRRQNQWAFDY